MIVWEEIGKGGFIHDKHYVVVVAEDEFFEERSKILCWDEKSGTFYDFDDDFGRVDYELSELSHFSEINLPVKGDYLK